MGMGLHELTPANAMLPLVIFTAKHQNIVVFHSTSGPLAQYMAAI